MGSFTPGQIIQIKHAVSRGMRRGRMDRHYPQLDSRRRYRLLMFRIMEELDRLPLKAEPEARPWCRFW